MPPKARSYDPARTRAALTAQLAAVAAVAHRLDADARALPSGLPGWDVHHLLVHIARQIEPIPLVLAEPATGKPDLDLSRWALSTASLAAALDEDTREAAAATRDAAARLDAALAALEPVAEEAVSTRPVRITLGTMRALDFTVTRLVELVVHCDDLAAATGVEVPLERQAVAAVVRLLADAFAVKAPGGAVELRIPPYAAVQCVAGPRHTRGTPPGVVETDPLTWIRLATGRVTWERALADARLTASGERADLGLHLPVLG